MYVIALSLVVVFFWHPIREFAVQSLWLSTLVNMFDLCHKATVEIFTHTGSVALFTGTIRVSRYQKGKSMWILLKQDNSQWQLHQLGRMQICISLQADNSASTPTLIFTARCYASAVLAMGLCPSVRLCLSQAGVLLKRQNVVSQKQHHTIPQGL